jgi:hypothetical protein
MPKKNTALSAVLLFPFPPKKGEKLSIPEKFGSILSS